MRTGMKRKKILGLTVVSFFFFTVIAVACIKSVECAEDAPLFTATGKTQVQELQEKIKKLPNLVKFGGFETPEDITVQDTVYAAWSRQGRPYELDTKVFHSGKASMRFDLDLQKAFADRIAQACQNISGTALAEQKIPYTLLVTGWGKGEEVKSAQFSIYLDIFFKDGTRDAWRVSFADGTHDWEFIQKKFEVTKEIGSISAYLIFRWGYGGVGWFDDVKICVFPAAETK